MIRYNKSVIDWLLEQQLLSSDPVNNCILFSCTQQHTEDFTENSSLTNRL